MVSFLSQVKEGADLLLDLIFPPFDLKGALKKVPEAVCYHCGEPFSDGAINAEFQCFKCRDRKSYFVWARSVYMAEGAVREAIHGFKYEGEFFQRRQLIEWLNEGFECHAAKHQWSAVVPVPLHSLRQRERGFNQAYELARGLAKQRKLPLWDCLKRRRETPTQTVLSREERWHNLHSAFSLKPKFDVKGQNLLLIDDVYTTGATCEGCARILAKAGASVVAVLTVARAK